MTVKQVVKLILQAFNDLEYSNTVFIDMQQAFDGVWHDGLLLKIKNLYIRASDRSKSGPGKLSRHVAR